jgi:hypothetical protein
LPIRNAAKYGAVHNVDNLQKQINLFTLHSVRGPERTIQDYTSHLLGFDWTPTEVRTQDGKKLSTRVTEIRLASMHAETLLTLFRKKVEAQLVIVVYFQGYDSEHSFLNL